MEQEPQLEERARFVLRLAEEALTLPDEVYMLQRYHTHLGGDYFLELRATSMTCESEFSDGNSRYIYLYKPCESGYCGAAFSLELNALVQDDEVAGITDDYTVIAEAIGATPPIQAAERTLLRQLLSVMERDDAGAAPDRRAVQALEVSFMTLLGAGAFITTKDVTRTHDDGTEVYARSQHIEGSLQHVWTVELEEPRLMITVGRDTDVNHTVLEETHAGTLESYEEIADLMARAAASAKEEDILRDEEDGSIICVSSDLVAEQVLVAAERAMGVRDLHPDQVALVEKYVQATFGT